MAYFTPVRGTRDEINQVAMVDGQFLYETDQGSGNRILADVPDSNGDLHRVQVGGERGEDNRLSALKDVTLTAPALGDYLKYNGGEWVNDSTLNAKVANLSPTGKFDGNNVTYDNTRSIIDVINTKTTLPTGGNVGDALCKTIDSVAWQKVKIDVIDSLDSTSTTEPLSANQGRNLKVSLESISAEVTKKQNAPREMGRTGQALCLDDSLQPIWKTISGGGGGGGGAEDWSDLEGKPFNKVHSDDTVETIVNPDFHIDKVTGTSGTIKTLMLNDALIYRPTDNDIIASNSPISYIPCSAVFAGNQVKKKIAWSDLVNRVQSNMFEVTNPQANDLLVYAEGKWKNDNTLYSKLNGYDNITIKKDGANNLYVSIDDSTIKAVGTGTNKHLAVPIDNNTIAINSDNNLAVPIDNKSIKFNAVSHKLEVGTDNSTIVINSNDKMEVPIDDSTIKLNATSRKLEVPVDNKTLKVNSSTRKLAVNCDNSTIIVNDSNQLSVPIDATSILFDGSGKLSVNYDNATIVVNSNNKLGVNYDGTTILATGDKLRVNYDNSTIKINSSTGKLEVPGIRTLETSITAVQTSVTALSSTVDALTTRVTRLEALLGKRLVTAEMSSGTLNFTSFTL